MTTPKSAAPDYDHEQYVADMAQFCNCPSAQCPCDGVLSGGMCETPGNAEESPQHANT
jgi:hypothetical protein